MSAVAKYLELLILIVFMAGSITLITLLVRVDNDNQYLYYKDKSLIETRAAVEYEPGTLTPKVLIPTTLNNAQLLWMPYVQSLATDAASYKENSTVYYIGSQNVNSTSLSTYLIYKADKSDTPKNSGLELFYDTYDTMKQVVKNNPGKTWYLYKKRNGIWYITSSYTPVYEVK